MLKAGPSLIKWTGSKRSQINVLSTLMPKNFERYFEPFLGSGAMLWNSSGRQAFASDIYTPLIELWKIVQTDPTKAIEHYEGLWNELQTELIELRNKPLREKNTPKIFYDARSKFNQQMIHCS